MQITIEKTEKITFDCNAERQRILSAFENGKQQDTLITIVNEFEKGNLPGCINLMKDFTRDDYENLHWTITDVISGYLEQNPKIEYRFTVCSI